MTKTLVLVFAVVAAAATNLRAAGPESLAAGAEQAFAKSVLSGSMAPAVMAERREAKAAAQNEYQKLEAAFKKGTAPKKEELVGWHAGRTIEKEFPEYPGSLLLAEPAHEGAPFKLVALTLNAGPTFYENMGADLAGGVAVFINDIQKDWSEPKFAPTGVIFERTLPEYEKGFSRFEVRKAADGRILVKHDWSSELGGSVSAGVEYGFFTKDVTPR
jgi:hypothetical protein